ncbi:MAG TPA: SRPBCC family protein [Streptosporangiaceae bacterium]|nr:SRPBCC family protein [Streptosporangiaceae bacterium]
MTETLKERTSGPMSRLRAEAADFVGALGTRALSSVQERIQGTTGRLSDYVEGGGGPGLMAAVTGARDMAQGKGPARSLLGAGIAGLKEKVQGMFGKGGQGRGGRKLKLTNIVESVDVGAPIRVVYDQWTQFADFPKFMKKVENVDQADDQKLNWKAQVFWSHRTWEATIVEQVPDSHIVWRSKGPKGHVDGAVSFHELAPNLTRVLLVLEYHPQGLFERTGNVWRAQGRRARLELKHFRRHVMTEVLLHADEVEGWRGEIRDSEVVKDHETAVTEEQDEREPGDEEQDDREPGGNDEYAGEPDRDEYAEAREYAGDAGPGGAGHAGPGGAGEAGGAGEETAEPGERQAAARRGRPAGAAGASRGGNGRAERAGRTGRAGERPARAGRRTTSQGGHG